MIDGLKELLADFKIETDDISLYEMAFTHRSYTNEHKECKDYDRLEFLGDSLLDMVVGDMVFHHFEDGDSGVLSKARAALVGGKTLSSLALSVYGMADLIRYSKGEQTNEKNHAKIQEDVFESFIGAMYLDQGYAFTRKVIEDIFNPLLDISLKLDEERNAKGRLQEKVADKYIQYVTLKVENAGKEDCKYYVSCMMDDQQLGLGTGHNTQEAETNAAKDALSKMEGL